MPSMPLSIEYPDLVELDLGLHTTLPDTCIHFQIIVVKRKKGDVADYPVGLTKKKPGMLTN